MPEVGCMLMQEGLQRGCSICPGTACCLLSASLSTTLYHDQVSVSIALFRCATGMIIVLPHLVIGIMN